MRDSDDCKLQRGRHLWQSGFIFGVKTRHFRILFTFTRIGMSLSPLNLGQPANREMFTFPDTVLGAELASVCNAALEQACMSTYASPAGLGMSALALREMFACGIMIAACQ